MNSSDLSTTVSTIKEIRSKTESDQEAAILWLALGIIRGWEEDQMFIEALQAQENGRMV